MHTVWRKQSHRKKVNAGACYMGSSQNTGKTNHVRYGGGVERLYVRGNAEVLVCVFKGVINLWNAQPLFLFIWRERRGSDAKRTPFVWWKVQIFWDGPNKDRQQFIAIYSTQCGQLKAATYYAPVCLSYRNVQETLKAHTSTCSSDHESKLIDLILEICTPMLRWMPAQVMHRKTPMFQDAHRGPTCNSHDKILVQF